MDVLFNKLLQEIECPVCFEYMLPPIKQCINGHNICGTCVQDLKKCPTCRGDLTDVKSRNAEILCRGITHPCKYRKSGCTGQFLVDSKAEHERICSYGPHKCPLYIDDECSWEGPMPEMETHIENSHENILRSKDLDKEETTSLTDYMKNIERESWRELVIIKNNTFLSYSKIINNLHFECYMFVGSREDTNNFKYRVTIKTPDGEQNVTSCLKCPNYLDFVNGNFPNKNCAAFYLEFTKQCVDDKDEMPLEYKITTY